jgi:hypothetical protein
MKPLAIDLFSGLGGWAEGLEAEGWDVIRFDLFDMFAETGTPKPPGCLLVRQDVLTIHGKQFVNADLIVASPPCQAYSYMAMPWSLAKAKAVAIRADGTGEALVNLNALFNACFRIQRECNEARAPMGLPPIPMVVENVKGAQPWVGRAKWAYGSYFLWGDIPALMPIQKYHSRLKVKEGEQWNINRANFTGTRGWDEGLKNPGFRFDGSGRSFQSESVARHVEGRKNDGGSWFNIGSPGQKVTGANPVGRLKPPARVSANPPAVGRKGAGAGAEWFDQNISSLPSGSKRRKAASAAIAKIPETLSRHIARVYRPDPERSAA